MIENTTLLELLISVPAIPRHLVVTDGMLAYYFRGHWTAESGDDLNVSGVHPLGSGWEVRPQDNAFLFIYGSDSNQAEHTFGIAKFDNPLTRKQAKLVLMEYLRLLARQMLEQHAAIAHESPEAMVPVGIDGASINVGEDWVAWYADGETHFCQTDGDEFSVHGHLTVREARRLISMYQRGFDRGHGRGVIDAQHKVRQALGL